MQDFGCRLVNMAFLAVIGSKSTNGVAYIHSEIIKETIFKVSNYYRARPLGIIITPSCSRLALASGCISEMT